jgi:hypothetical protein
MVEGKGILRLGASIDALTQGSRPNQFSLISNYQ